MDRPTPVIAQLDISRPARALWLLRFVDYALVLFGGSMVLANLQSLILESASENWASLAWRAAELGFVCFAAYTGWRNVGTIDASAWRSLLGVALTLVVVCAAFLGKVVSNGFTWRDQSAVVNLMGLAWLGAGALSAAVGLFALPRLRVAPLGLRVVDVLQHLTTYLGADRRLHKSLFAPESRRALAYATAGAATLLAWYLAPVPTSERGLSLYYRVGQQIQPLGFFLLFRARLHLQVSARVLLANDARAPVLFLRSFDDDEKPSYPSAERALFDFSLETRLANHFSRVGPFIAVGSPKDKLALPGAARAQLSDEQWQPQVLQWMREARLILMYSGKTHWVNWELTNILQLGRASDLILLFPEIKAWRRATRVSEIRARAEQVRAVFKGTPWQEELDALDDLAGLRAMLFRPDGSMVMIKSRTRSRDSYHLAALIAHVIWLDPELLSGKLPARPALTPALQRRRLRVRIAGAAVAVGAVALAAVLGKTPGLATRAAASLTYAMADVDERREIVAAQAAERGEALLAQQQYAAARSAYQTACDIRRELAQRPNASAAAKYQLATSFEGLGDVARAQHQLDEALADYQHMSEAALAAARDEPRDLVAQRAVFVAYNMIGAVYTLRDAKPEALRAHRQALEIARALAHEQPGAAQARSDLLMTTGVVAELEYVTSDYAAAQKHCQELLALYEPSSNDLDALREHAQTLHLFGLVLEARAKLVEAQQAMASAGLIWSRIAAADDAAQSDRASLASTLQKAAELAVAAGHPDVARDTYTRALQFEERVLARHPNDVDAQRTAFVWYHKLGQLLLDQDSAQARKLFQAALALGVQLAQHDPHAQEPQSDLAVTYLVLSDIELDAGRFEAARALLEPAVELRRRLAADQPSDLDGKRALAEALDSLGTALLRGGAPARALERYDESMALRRGVTEAAPDSAADVRELLLSANRLAEALSALDKAAQARALASQHGSAQQLCTELAQAERQLERLNAQLPKEDVWSLPRQAAIRRLCSR